jgi:hypothetical protein
VKNVRDELYYSVKNSVNGVSYIATHSPGSCVLTLRVMLDVRAGGFSMLVVEELCSRVAESAS